MHTFRNIVAYHIGLYYEQETKSSSVAGNPLSIWEVHEITLGRAALWNGGLVRLQYVDFVLQRDSGTISSLVNGFLFSA